MAPITSFWGWGLLIITLPPTATPAAPDAILLLILLPAQPPVSIIANYYDDHVDDNGDEHVDDNDDKDKRNQTRLCYLSIYLYIYIYLGHPGPRKYVKQWPLRLLRVKGYYSTYFGV